MVKKGEKMTKKVKKSGQKMGHINNSFQVVLVRKWRSKSDQKVVKKWSKKVKKWPKKCKKSEKMTKKGEKTTKKGEKKW